MSAATKPVAVKQTRLSNDEFFAELHTILNAATEKQKTSVFLTQKPLNPATTDGVTPLLVRAKTSKKTVNIATVVEPDALGDFFVRYADVWKQGMGSLKKRDKKKVKKKGKGGAGTGAGVTKA